MKFICKLCLILSISLGLAGAAFTIPWWTLDGGGGKSTGTTGGGTVFTLTGTIGQFDTTAAGSSGGPVQFTGGFWAQLADVAVAGQMLSLSRLPNGDASLQWQSNAAGWQMETSANLTNWSDIGSTITTAGELTIPYDPQVPKRFFRLRHP